MQKIQLINSCMNHTKRQLSNEKNPPHLLCEGVIYQIIHLSNANVKQHFLHLTFSQAKIINNE